MMPKQQKTPVIGLEVHVELSTNSKMFCGCPADHFGKAPNTQTCPVCLGLPGALPVPNKKAIDWTIMIGLALNCRINHHSKFDRKHYFYPDLPKGYQISQYDKPLCVEGLAETSAGNVSITRVHLEEDTGKLQHATLDGQKVSLVDFNRSGVPLVEIVSEPDIHSAAQAKDYAQKIRDIIRSLEVSDCDMEKGSMRLEANISLAKTSDMIPGLTKKSRDRILPPYKVEVKNINSFRFLERAIDYELTRQKELLDQGQIPKQETRGWSEKENKTTPQRSKETAADYRYFPEPDIPPLTFDSEYIEALRRQLPELPESVIKRLETEFSIRAAYAKVIGSNKVTTMYALEAFALGQQGGVDAESIASLIVNRKVDIKQLTPQQLIDNLKREGETRVGEGEQLRGWIAEAIKQSPQAVADYRAGKVQAIGVLIGKIMQISGGKANAAATKTLLEEKLTS